MPLLKVFLGMQHYQDMKSVEDLITYPFKEGKGYLENFGNADYRNILWEELDGNLEYGISYVINQFYTVQQLNTKAITRMNHFVVSFSDLEAGQLYMIDSIKQMILNFLGGPPHYCQVFCVEHWKNNHPHVHFIFNHIGMYGNVFYGRNTEYGGLLTMLRNSTGLKWTFCQAQQDDYQ